jgi:Fe-Mn family superoxide dismutase
VPIIGIDIWEHAFYLQYKNVKPDVRAPRAPYSHSLTSAPVQYLNAIWNVINFEEAEKRLAEATSA